MRLTKALRYFAFFWIATLSFATLEYSGFRSDTGFLKLKQLAVKTGWYLPAFYSPIFGSSVILLCGFFQFNNKLKERIRIHRTLGRVYVYGVLFFAAPGAYVMTFFINRGAGVFLSFLMQNTLWIVFTFGLIYNIKNGNLKAHKEMAIRSYCLAFAAVTLRFYIWLFNVFGNGVNFENNYLIIALLSWIPNLLVGELLINRRIYSRINTSL